MKSILVKRVLFLAIVLGFVVSSCKDDSPTTTDDEPKTLNKELLYDKLWESECGFCTNLKLVGHTGLAELGLG
jgi:hypothetical protein